MQLIWSSEQCFQSKEILFSPTEKRGCDRATSPLYEPKVHLRFEI